MHRMILVLTLLLTGQLSIAAEQDQQGYLKALAQAGKLIRPAHEQFFEQSRRLQNELSLLCSNRDQAHLEHARQQWRQTMDSWMQVSILNFGPVMENDRRIRIQSWPIRDRLMKGAVNQLVNGETAPTLQDIENGSVAIQGLPAIEYLLFQEDALAQLDHRHTCLSLQLISRHLGDLARTINEQWQQDYGRDFINPAAVAGGFDLPEQAYDELINGLVTAIQQIKRRKLEEPFGLAGKSGKISDLESYRSQNSMTNTKNNLQALVRYLKGGEGYGVDDYLQARQPDGIALLILEERLSGLSNAGNALSVPFETLIASKDSPQQADLDTVRALFKELSLLNKAFENQIFPILGITRDFNSEDGD